MHGYITLLPAILILLGQVQGMAINPPSSSEASSPEGISCLVNPANDPLGNTPPASCAQSTALVTFETCSSTCSCNADGTVSCNGLDSSCTGDALLDVCAGYWGCMCLPSFTCPETGEPASTGCGLGLGHGFTKRDESTINQRSAQEGEADSSSPPNWGESDSQYVPFCSGPTSGAAFTMCGSLNVTEEVCEAYLQDPLCTCTDSGSLSCTVGSSATGCSDADLTAICAANFGCGCEFDAGCFCDSPANTIPCSAYGCGVGLGHGGWK